MTLLAVLVLAAAGCGGDDDDGRTTAAGGQTTAPAATEARGDRGAAGRGGGSSSGPAYTGDVEQARAGGESIDDVYENFAAAVDDGISATDVAVRDTLDTAASNESLTRVCDLMSERAKQQTITYAKRSAGLADVKWNCENATGLLLRRASQTGGGLKRSLQAKIVGVNVEGDRATASVRFGGKGPITSISLVKEDGDWKLAASPSGGDGK